MTDNENPGPESEAAPTDKIEPAAPKPAQEPAADQKAETPAPVPEAAPRPAAEPAAETAAERPKAQAKPTQDKQKRAPIGGLTPIGFALRFGAAVALVFGTFNPSGSSYYHWVEAMEGGDAPAKILLGLLILAGWVVFFRATARSLGPVGAFLAAAVCGVILWWLIDLSVLEAENTVAITYAVLVVVSVILTLGLTGSFLWRRLTGQYHVSDGDDGGED